jgi:hypothetical protein
LLLILPVLRQKLICFLAVLSQSWFESICSVSKLISILLVMLQICLLYHLFYNRHVLDPACYVSNLFWILSVQ